MRWLLVNSCVVNAVNWLYEASKVGGIGSSIVWGTGWGIGAPRIPFEESSATRVRVRE